MVRRSTVVAMKWLRDCQKKDKEPAEDLVEGGVNGPDGGGKPGVASGGGGATVAGPSMVKKKASPQGWCYSDHADHKAYGSMTAGGVGSLGVDWKKDAQVASVAHEVRQRLERVRSALMAAPAA